MKKRTMIVSRFNEDLEWLKDYKMDYYIVYNKGTPIYGDAHILNIPNVGGNIIDIFSFVYYHYDNLPDLMIFVQGYPFDHCKKEVFDKLIYNTRFTPLEYYGMTPNNNWEQRDNDGGFLEINNNWYVAASNSTFNQGCRYSGLDEFMNKYFENYKREEWVRFAPGGQYIITKQQGLQYPLSFWKSMIEEMNSGKLPSESYIVERGLYYILTGKYRLRKEFYE